MRKVMVLVVLPFLAAASPGEPGPSYESCASAVDPSDCLIDIAHASGQRLEREDLIAAGAYDLLSQLGDRPGAEAARVVAGSGSTPTDAAAVIGSLRDLAFSDPARSVIPGPGITELLERVVTAPVSDLRTLAEGMWLAQAADRPDLVQALVQLARPEMARSNNDLAAFASVAARVAGRDDIARAFMEAGGVEASNYRIEGLNGEIAEARLHRGYDAEAAATVLALGIADDEGFAWPSEEMEALAAADAYAEMRALADARLVEARDEANSAEERTDDFGAAAWLLDEAGDRPGALAVLREGLPLVPRAVGRRSRTSDPRPPAVQSNGFGAWPVELLYQFGAREEALATGYLSGRERYHAALESGETPDPEWVLADQEWNNVEMIAATLDFRNLRTEAARLRAAVLAQGENGLGDFDVVERAATRMLLAAVAGDARGLDADFRRALEVMDRMEPDDAHWWAVRLAIARRGAQIRLDQTLAQLES